MIYKTLTLLLAMSVLPTTTCFAAPGDIITFEAASLYNGNLTKASYKAVVLSPISSNNRPIYVTGCWRRNGSGSYVFSCPLVYGWFVRAFIWSSAQKKLIEGAQASDGSVVADGISYERVPGM
ncbi:MAG: hypothetical protein ABFD83_11615 [Armatimonadota bacterium]